jgi:hypothetical protein
MFAITKFYTHQGCILSSNTMVSKVSTLLLLVLVNCFVSDGLSRVKRADIDLQTCIDNFDIHRDKIIRTQDSRNMGATYLTEFDLGTREECLRLCCETDNCDVFVFEEKVTFTSSKIPINLDVMTMHINYIQTGAVFCFLSADNCTVNDSSFRILEVVICSIVAHLKISNVNLPTTSTIRVLSWPSTGIYRIWRVKLSSRSTNRI